VLVLWKFDRLGRGLRHLINTIYDLTNQGISLKVLTGHVAVLDTTTAAGKLVFGIFAALAEFECELIVERTRAGLAAERARGRKRGAPFKRHPPNSGCHGRDGPAGNQGQRLMQGVGDHAANALPPDKTVSILRDQTLCVRLDVSAAVHF
jgi:hypothetical protein